MIILDTNVLSELIKPAPARRVTTWIAAQPVTGLATTSITQSEILHGILLLPSGKRRSAIETAVEAMFSSEFGGRILAFGSDAAPHYARIAAARRRAGRPISQFDAQIAAIACSTGSSIATRNVTDFEGCGVRLINPWDA
jgi:predicted nucleic acid-binding protein